MRLATWNVNSLRVRLDHLLQFGEQADLDVICLQETKLTDDQFPSAEIAEAGWPHQLIDGQQTYNGVAILSKTPLSDPQKGWKQGEADRGKRMLAATVQGVRIYDCYMPNGKSVDHPDFQYKLGWIRRLLDEIDANHTPTDKVLVCGDWNLAPDDASVWDPFELEGHLHFHPAEREIFEAYLDWGFTDSYRDLNPFSSAFTWWNYQKMGFSKNHGLRIDHILLTEPLMDACDDVTIWRDVRGWDQPSDHCPVVAEFTP